MGCVDWKPRRTQETPLLPFRTRLGPTVPQFSSFKALCTPSCLASNAINESRRAKAIDGKTRERDASCPGSSRNNGRHAPTTLPEHTRNGSLTLHFAPAGHRSCSHVLCCPRALLIRHATARVQQQVGPAGRLFLELGMNAAARSNLQRAGCVHTALEHCTTLALRCTRGRHVSFPAGTCSCEECSPTPHFPAELQRRSQHPSFSSNTKRYDSARRPEGNPCNLLYAFLDACKRRECRCLQARPQQDGILF